MKENYDLLNSVSETLFIPLAYKAEETKRNNPIITDKKACEIIKKVDFDFPKLKNKRASRVGIALRANYFDQQVIDFIKNHENPVVISLGCGLDTRYDRIGHYAEKAKFYHVDLESVINIRQTLIPPKRNDNYISSSMFDDKWIRQIKEETNHSNYNFIIVIEGVIMYFPENENKSLFNRLAKEFKGAYIAFDLLNKWMSLSSKKHESVKCFDATFKSGLDDEREIEKWADGLTYMETKLLKDCPRFEDMGLLWASKMRFIPKYRTQLRMVMYKTDM
ncbi:class I SAM-dependent methyltransferase [Xenorhabdus sp. PB62.4]|uniref:class I SAM-dependent methyltransferase n=1 Tax=Xenorhabdus sp. PB62.4 TaxID=1851573 RepID=UPI001656EB7E|nr:class I SAM-dependent methyltransferase [Xenorhabdus sp. PB62.4]MBC8951926.1 hypothetical protein [Xenorhabdus sp. PB62.4]